MVGFVFCQYVSKRKVVNMIQCVGSLLFYELIKAHVSGTGESSRTMKETCQRFGLVVGFLLVFVCYCIFSGC